MSKRVLFVEPVDPSANEYLEAKGYTVDIAKDNSVSTIKSIIPNYDAVLTRSAPFTSEIIDNAPKLKVIGRFGIGVDHIDLEKANERGIYVVNAPTASIDSVAEQTAAMILALSKNIVIADNATRQGDWHFRNRELSTDIKNKVLGIIGLGKIGLIVAKKMYFGFDMKIMAYDPFLTESPEYIRLTTLDELLKSSDYVSLHSPATTETIHLINSKTLALMKPSAFLVNMSRGAVINENDLVDALNAKTIAGAALDVFEKEPPDLSCQLFKMKNVILSPHYAALSHETAIKMGIHAAQGIDEVLSGRQPTWWVNRNEMRKERKG